MAQSRPLTERDRALRLSYVVGGGSRQWTLRPDWPQFAYPEFNTVSREAVNVRNVRHLGSAPAARGSDWALIGQDGGQSIDLGDRTLFFFSDTLLARLAHAPSIASPTASAVLANEGQGIFLGNCAALSSATDLRAALRDLTYFSDEAGRPREILPVNAFERLGGVRFWPQHGIQVGKLIHFFYLGIAHRQPGTWGFEALGTGLATIDPATGECQRTMGDSNWCLWDQQEQHFHLGVQLLREGQTIYVFGSRRIGTQSHAVLSRVSVDQINVPSAYEYLVASAPSWTNDAREAGDLGPAGGEYSVSFNAYLEKYLMVYVDGFDKQLVLRTAPRPWGPFDAPRKIGRLPHDKDVAFISLGFEHPRFATGEGRTIYLSYCQPHFIQNALVAVKFA